MVLSPERLETARIWWGVVPSVSFYIFTTQKRYSSLEFRQLRGDMIQVYKIANKFYDPISTSTIFDFSTDSRLRGHSLKISKQSVNKSKYANFFTNGVVNSWNNLPENIVKAKSLNEFKNLYDKLNENIQYSLNITE